VDNGCEQGLNSPDVLEGVGEEKSRRRKTRMEKNRRSRIREWKSRRRRTRKWKKRRRRIRLEKVEGEGEG